MILLNALLIFFPSISFFSKIDVIHTVGPTNRSESALISCYETCLQLVLDYKIRSVVCLILFGVFRLSHRRKFNALFYSMGCLGCQLRSFLSRPSLHLSINSYKHRKIYDLLSPVGHVANAPFTGQVLFFSLFL